MSIVITDIGRWVLVSAMELFSNVLTACSKYVFECLGYNFQPEDLNDSTRTASAYHKIIETFRYAYARRALLGDKNFANVTEVS